MANNRKTFSHHVDISKIKTTNSVIAELENLNSLLPTSSLLRVAFFNRAYMIITKKINQASSSGLFDHPKEMSNLEVAFAIRYFEALNSYVRNGTLPGAWRGVKKRRFHLLQPASISLMQGANAHINHDLLPSLVKSIHNPMEFHDDFFKVNGLLIDSSKEISRSYYETEEAVNYFKKVLRPIYLKPTMWLILRWRTAVWKDYVKK